MTNDQTESLLSRFAAVSQRLKGTGAPEVPAWILPFDEGGDLCDGIACHRYDNYVYNPAASLGGYVMWAMEVSSHPTATDVVDSNVVFKKSVGMWLGCYSFEGQDDYRRFTTKEEAWCFVLESIADAIGGE